MGRALYGTDFPAVSTVNATGTIDTFTDLISYILHCIYTRLQGFAIILLWCALNRKHSITAVVQCFGITREQKTGKFIKVLINIDICPQN